MKFSVLSSGSKANCIYISSGKTNILLDCGLSARETLRRLKNLSIDPESIDAIVISHEHGDHVRGVMVLNKMLNIPIFVSEETFMNCPSMKEVSLHQIYFIEPRVLFSLGELSFYPFCISHDAARPVAFRVSDGSRIISVVTDLGDYDEEVLSASSNCDALIIESNHEEEKLWLSAYPWELKKRISGSMGHLSNAGASRFIYELTKRDVHRSLKFIGAAHVSENSNTYDIALRAIKDAWSDKNFSPHFFVANVKDSTELFSLN